MKQRSKVIATSIATIAMCASLAVGGTFALFTSESEVNIAVTAGNVELTATIDERSVQTYSGKANGGKTNTAADYDTVAQTMPSFANGGYVELSGGTLYINNITPMDEVTFNIVLKNESTIQINYQTIVESVDEGLLGGLEVEIGDVAYTSENGKVISQAETLVAADKEVTIPVSIALPYDASSYYEGKECTLIFTVAAVQGNANALYEPTVKKEEEEKADIFTIYTASDLVEFSSTHTEYKGAELANDIDLAGIVFTPIGSSDQKFTGTFDGNNHTISNLKITGKKSYVGLFGFTVNGEIKNLTVHNAQVSGRLGVGVVAGSPYTSKYSNISVTGDVEVNGMSYVGGVFGRNLYASVDNITVNVSENSYVYADSVEDGVAYRTYVGGVVGFMGEGGHTVSNVTSNIDVYGSTIDVGGITGIAHYNNKFINCSSSGDVSIVTSELDGDAFEIGGIAGVWHNENDTSVTFENCHYTGNLSVMLANGGDFYGVFENQGIVGKAYSATGTGTLNMTNCTSSYVAPTAIEIDSKADMFSFAWSVNTNKQSFKGYTVNVTADIDLGNDLWTPIGQTGATEFKGVFDGGNHTIKNLYIDSSAQTNGHYSSGLFGWIEDHAENIVIKNVKMDGATVKGNHNVAVIVGYTYGGDVINCHVTNANVEGTHANDDACGDKVGVIAGYASNEGVIENCTVSNSKVFAGRDAGQIVGAGYTACVVNCTAMNVTVLANGTCSDEKNVNESVIGRVL